MLGNDGIDHRGIDPVTLNEDMIDLVDLQHLRAGLPVLALAVTYADDLHSGLLDVGPVEHADKSRFGQACYALLSYA